MRMFRPLVVLAALALALPGCGQGGGAASPPAEAPPPIETERSPGSRLVEPRVETLVRQMSERLARATA